MVEFFVFFFYLFFCRSIYITFGYIPFLFLLFFCLFFIFSFFLTCALVLCAATLILYRRPPIFSLSLSAQSPVFWKYPGWQGRYKMFKGGWVVWGDIFSKTKTERGFPSLSLRFFTHFSLFTLPLLFLFSLFSLSLNREKCSCKVVSSFTVASLQVPLVGVYICNFYIIK